MCLETVHETDVQICLRERERSGGGWAVEIEISPMFHELSH